MKTEEFHVLTAALEKLTPHQRSILVDRLHKIEHVQAVSTLVESRVQEKPLCPKCGYDHIARRVRHRVCSVTVALRAVPPLTH